MNNDSTKLFGARLRSARRTAALSQEDMAEMLGVSRQVISKWERGVSSPTMPQLAALVAMYCVCAHTLLFGEPYREVRFG